MNPRKQTASHWGGGADARRDQAEALAIEALTFLAADPERLGRFLALSGLTPATLRAAAATPGFLAAVLDHLTGDASLLLSFTANAGHDPGDVDQARAVLAGPEPSSSA